jgi:hypothetical protein
MKLLLFFDNYTLRRNSMMSFSLMYHFGEMTISEVNIVNFIFFDDEIHNLFFYAIKITIMFDLEPILMKTLLTIKMILFVSHFSSKQV